jgi:YidC/Oxa1 family membrane protein insertase
MNEDNKNALIGLVLILVVLFGWNLITAPSQAQMDEQKRVTDSTALAQHRLDSLNNIKKTMPQATVNDTVLQAQQINNFGSLADLTKGTLQDVALENDVFKVVFTNKGGRIKDVILKKHFKLTTTSDKKEEKVPLHLFEDLNNRFEYVIPAATASGKVSTDDIYFTPSVSASSVTFTAKANNGTTLQQSYTISPDGYMIDHAVQFKGLGPLIKPNTATISLNIENNLDKLEKNVSYERNYSYLNFKENNETADYIRVAGQERKDLNQKPVQWIAHCNQFFTTAIISQNGGFKSAVIGGNTYDDSQFDLKKMVSTIEIPTQSGEVNANMKLYIGPKDYKSLKKYDIGLQDVVAYGGSVLGTVNRYIIRPIFDFLQGIFGNAATCILLLTLIVKALLYPLSYKGLKSQAKMTALKPELDKMKAKYKDDAQKIQVEQMKIYSEYGVQPLGGCLPQMLQMPIWMALFNFFPASIDFRQQGFLWATDLTGFEEFIKLPFHLPLYGAHISLFALLWGASLVAFTWYTMKDTDMTGQPAFMKQLQYITPIFFTIMFNSYAAGLSLYMLFSNLLNIGQTMVTKEYVIDKAAIRNELENNKKKPKKVGAFRQKFDQMMKDQQAAKEQQEKASAKKK